MKKIVVLLLLFYMVCLTVCIYAGQNFTNNLSSGELSPLVKYRIDIAQRQSGTEEMTNFMVKQTGQAVRRPGTEYITAVKMPVYSTVGMGVSTAGTSSNSQFLSVSAKAQTFIPPYDINCTSIKVRLWKNAAYTGTLTLKIANADSTWYAGSKVVAATVYIATADTVSSTAITDTVQFGTLYEFTFSSPVTLLSTQMYAIVVSATYNGTNYCYWDTCPKTTSYGGSYGGSGYSKGETYWVHITGYSTANLEFELFGTAASQSSTSWEIVDGNGVCPARLIPFAYSNSDAYIVCFGNGSVGFYRTEQ